MAPILFLALLALAIVFTFSCLLSYGVAKSDYGMVCIPSTGQVQDPRCLTDLSDVSLFGALSVVGFLIVGVGLCLNFLVGLGPYPKRYSANETAQFLQAILYFLAIVTLLLVIYGVYFFLWAPTNP